MNNFQKLFMVDADSPSEKVIPPNPERAAPINQQREFYEEQRAKETTALPDQVDFSAILSAPAAEEGKELPAIPSLSSSLTDDALRQLAEKVSFADHVPAEFKADNPDAAKAMEQLSKAAYLTALKHVSALVDAGLTSYDKRASVQNKRGFEEFLADTPWRDDNTFGRADVSPVMKPVIAKLKEKFPTAPDEWIRTQAKNYLVTVGQSAASDLGVSFGSENTNSGRNNGENKKMDWFKYAGVSPQVPNPSSN